MTLTERRIEMFKKTIQDISQFFRKLSRLCFYLVVIVASMFLSFLVIKAIVHAYVWIQEHWPAVWWIF